MRVIKNYKTVLFIISISLLYIAFLLHSQDADMFFTIYSGKELLQNNFIYNNSTHLPIIIQQWLYAIILYKIDQFGYIGDILFVFIQNIILWIISYKFIYLKTNNKYKAYIIPIVCTLICNTYMINIRPQIITMILLVSQIYVLEKYKLTNNWKLLLYLILIGILSANFHQAVFLYHMYVMLPYMLNINTKNLIDYKVVLFTIIMLTTILLTPYGINGFLFIFKVAKSNAFNNIDILEIEPITITSFLGVCAVIMLLYVLIINYLHKSNIYINFYAISIILLSLMSVRHMSILYIPLLFIFTNIEFNISIPILYLYSILFLSSLIFISRLNTPLDLVKTNTPSTLYNIETIIPKNARVFNTMNIGGYLEYLGYNNIRLDTRPELYTSEFINENRLDEYIATEKCIDKDGFYLEDNTIKKYLTNYDYIILNSNAYANKLMIDLNYKQIYSTNYLKVYKSIY